MQCVPYREAAAGAGGRLGTPKASGGLWGKANVHLAMWRRAVLEMLLFVLFPDAGTTAIDLYWQDNLGCMLRVLQSCVVRPHFRKHR